MHTKPDRNAARLRRHRRVRKHVAGTAERPRLAVHRSLRHIGAQIVDDGPGHTLVSASTAEPALRSGSGLSVATAEAVGRAVAERARAHGIETVVFDRGGYLYHGRVKALAEAARAAGLRF
ncbi:MAG: 50S ribosomal protein L18 [Chloroflexi bacterium]|nr:50S ribosomal protein L18 [Chloroflexota bacterium]